MSTFPEIVVVSSTLGSDLADNGTTTFTLPTGYNESMIALGGHKLVVKNGATYTNDAEFNVSVAGATVTLTNRTEATIGSGSVLYLELKLRGQQNQEVRPTFKGKVGNTQLVTVNLGAPDASDDDGICASASITSAAGGTIGGAYASSGVATLDVPRNIIITSAGNDSAKTFTITGTDEYGKTVRENITGANAGIANGKKAFKTVTVVAIDSNSASTVKVGTGDVLGLPFFLPSAGYIVKELEDGAAATAGTTVAGVQTEPTATTGDVRGTYDPNSACNADKNFSLIIAVQGEIHTGATQYSG